MDHLFNLVSEFQPAGHQPRAIVQLVEGLNDGLAHQTLLGVTGSGKTFTLAQVIAEVQRPALVLAPNKTLAAQLYGEMKSFFPKNAVEYFVSYYDYYQPEAYVPASGLYIEKDASINEQIEQMRLSATKSILERKDVIIVATVSAIYGLGDPNAYMSMILHLQVGQKIDQRDILRRLADMQYTRNDVDFFRGNYRVRGEVLDVFPAESSERAIRIQLFEDEIETLSFFDPLTNAMKQKVQRLTIYPKSHYVTPKSTVSGMIDAVKVELRDRLAYFHGENRLVEAQRLQERVNYDLEMLINLGYCSGIENYSRYLSGRKAGEPPPTLIDYLPPNALVIVDESHVTIPQLGAMYRGDASRKGTLVDYGFRLPSAMDNRPMRFDEFDQIAPKQRIFVSATPGEYEKTHSDQVVELVVRPTGLLDPQINVRPVKNQVDDLLSEIRVAIDKNQRVLVTTLTKRMAEDLSNYYSELNIKVRYLHADIGTVERTEILHELRMGTIDVLIGINLLREGLDLPEVALVAVLDADKEGFLRSGRSLIQTAGRAARHLDGRVLFYADTVTPSMKLAMDETDRRRKIQSEFNREHGIIPRGVRKELRDSLLGEELVTDSTKVISPLLEISEDAVELAHKIKKLEKEMLRLAKELQFEKAAHLRDQVAALREKWLMQ